MRKLILAAAAVAIVGLTTTAARAEIEYPYCGYAREGAGGCTFSTIDQCRAFVSGAGGGCHSNPRYTAKLPAASRSRR